MNTTLARTVAMTAAGIALAAVALTGCSSDSGSAAPAVDRTNARAVADAFMTAYAGGDLAAACTFTTDQEKASLIRTNDCTSPAGWAPQVPRAYRSCTNKNGAFQVFYETNEEVDQNFAFDVTAVKQADSTWAVDSINGQETARPFVNWCDDPTKIVNSG